MAMPRKSVPKSISNVDLNSQSDICNYIYLLHDLSIACKNNNLDMAAQQSIVVANELLSIMDSLDGSHENLVTGGGK